MLCFHQAKSAPSHGELKQAVRIRRRADKRSVVEAAAGIKRPVLRVRLQSIFEDDSWKRSAVLVYRLPVERDGRVALSPQSGFWPAATGSDSEEKADQRDG